MFVIVPEGWGVVIDNTHTICPGTISSTGDEENQKVRGIIPEQANGMIMRVGVRSVDQTVW
ncbi:hypothetical protein KSX_54350 [Ktedonospora formicarum]|uniref:Uncharacterized protein n=1 Tax=Ktedonospora formicarum TaxID=2778364 RepID=A0A8J3I745_9CHLR|nr:hypothetical protein KSX_54350 [Ktedonospora formicarum]